MKRCPQCQNRYSDDTLRFCLQDGTPLVSDTATGEPPTVMLSEEPTVVRPSPPERINFEIPSTVSYQTAGATRDNFTDAAVPPAKKSNTTMIVLLTALLTLIVAAVGGVGAWIFFKNKRETVQITNKNSADNQNVKANKAENVNKADETPTPTATPASVNQNATAATPTPLSKKEADRISEDVSDLIDEWRSASEDGDLDGHLSFYAPTVDYYNRKNASAAFVRGDKQKAYAAYENIDIGIGNIRVTPNQTGDEATAVFDKKWEFSGEEKYSSGKVQSELKLKKIGGAWKITGERDVKVYYVNK